MNYHVKPAREIEKGDKFIHNSGTHCAAGEFIPFRDGRNSVFGKYGYIPAYDSVIGRYETIYTYEKCPLVVINND